MMYVSSLVFKFHGGVIEGIDRGNGFASQLRNTQLGEPVVLEQVINSLLCVLEGDVTSFFQVHCCKYYPEKWPG